MIITLTGNLLAERTFEFERWSPGKTQRATREYFQVGGKGINVSKMLQRIRASTTAWCFAGGSSGADCERWLVEKQIPHRIFATQHATRTGLVVRSASESETTFLGPDRAPDAEALAECVDALRQDSNRSGSHVLALCGSFPGWLGEDAEALRETVKAWAHERKFVADTYGPPLAWALEQPTFLIKINRDEFDALTGPGQKARPMNERLNDAIARWPVLNWIVTDGPGPVWYGGKDMPAAEIDPIPVEEVSATGSGDVLLACVLEGLVNRQLPLGEALTFALPYAAANAADAGVAEFELNNLPAPRSVQP
ncbi:MAG TPA: PfkB family carbohydrate kinase [Opitutaceae bacterium]|nr:PfkB family carbohydrate kinase [Opitutaceae bacterium]